MKLSTEEFTRLHEIARAADAVARLHYPCTCYQHECPHGELIKALGWPEAISTAYPRWVSVGPPPKARVRRRGRNVG